MLLETFIKAKRKEIVTENDIGYKLDELEIVYQILEPCYDMNVALQFSDATIGDVLSFLLLTIYGALKKFMIEDINFSNPRDSLVENIKKKFKYELSTSIYYSAAILNISSLKNWYQRSFSKVFIKKAFETLEETAQLFKDIDQEKLKLIQSERNNKKQKSQTQPTFQTATDLKYKKLSKSVSQENIVINQVLDNEIKLKVEIKKFIAYLNEVDLENTQHAHFGPFTKMI